MPGKSEPPVSLMDRYRTVRRRIREIGQAAHCALDRWKSRSDAHVRAVIGATVLLILFLVRLGLLVADVPIRWLVSILDAIAADRGYLTVGTIAAAYLAIYGLVDAKRLREENQAITERSTFVALVTSGEPANFVVALKSFGPVQTMKATKEPLLFSFWTWARQTMPNMEFMHRWARNRLSNCTAGVCSRNPDVRVDLTDADLRDAMLREVDLSHANLARANLSNANLAGVNLTASTLTHVNLSYAYLARAFLPNADLRGSNLRGVNLSEAWLEKANLSDEDVMFKNAPPSPIDMSKANLSQAHLQNANLHGILLIEADLRGADLRGVDLRGANLSGATLSHAKYNRGTAFPEALDPVKAGLEFSASIDSDM